MINFISSLAPVEVRLSENVKQVVEKRSYLAFKKLGDAIAISKSETMNDSLTD